MEHTCLQTYGGQRGSAALAAMAICLSMIAHAPARAAESSSPGRLNFEAANLPEAKVEVDLSQDMFHDLFGIGDAAIAGVAETLMKSSDGNDGARGTRMAAEQLEAARQIVQLAGNVIREVRVRVYEGLPEAVDDAQKLIKPLEDQIKEGSWETLARVRDEENMVRVAAVRSEGSIKGIFVVASDGDNVVLANIVCDVSPDNVKKLTSAATKVGLENGLAAEIERKMMMKMGGPGKSVPTIVIKNGEVEKVLVSPDLPKVKKPPVPPTPPAPPAKPAKPAKEAPAEEK
jgi:uncharacterized protein DUF4252